MLERDELLRRVGLETHTPTSDFFTGLGLFAVGVLVGAGLGLMFAPKRGEDMRAMMTEAWKNRPAARPARTSRRWAPRRRCRRRRRRATERPPRGSRSRITPPSRARGDGTQAGSAARLTAHD